MIQAYKNFWKSYVDFTGRSTRSDYWWAVLANYLVIILALIIAVAIEDALDSSAGAALSVIILILIALYIVAIILPFIAIQIRRLHDAGYHGAFLLLSFVPFGRLALTIMYCQPTKYDFVYNNYNQQAYAGQPQFGQDPYQNQTGSQEQAVGQTPYPNHAPQNGQGQAFNQNPYQNQPFEQNTSQNQDLDLNKD